MWICRLNEKRPHVRSAAEHVMGARRWDQSTIADRMSSGAGLWVWVRTSPPVWSVLPWRALVCCAAAACIVGGGAAACIAEGGAAVQHRRRRRSCSVAATSPGGCCSPRCRSPRGLGLPTGSPVRAAPQIAGGRGLVNPAARARCATDRRWACGT